MSLTERISQQAERRDPESKVTPIKERRQPEWVRRAQESRLSAKDMSAA